MARHEGNSRLGPLLSIPAELLDARLLIIIDNLHLRVSTDADQHAAPYLDRLDNLLAWFDRQLPGNVRVIAAARDEPRFQKQLDLSPDQPSWRGFGLFRLPRLTDDGLGRLLSALALQANVAVAAEELPKLIENSDRTPATVYINVAMARHKRFALTPGAWKPTQGEPWRLRFVEARAAHAGVDAVCQAVDILTRAGLPARVPYVQALARAGGTADPQAVVGALVDEGLLRLRLNVLAPFSAEQLQELLGDGGEALTKMDALVETIEQAIVASNDHPDERTDDLLAFALTLSRLGRTDRAERIATRAIELDAGKARAYRIRAAIRFDRRDLSGIEEDLTQSIALDDAMADSYFGRAAIRTLIAKYEGALDDLASALRLGRDDGAVHAQRGTAYFQLRRWPEAIAAMTDAVERGERTATIFFTRGMARYQQNDLAGAESDLSEALERSIDIDSATDQLRQFETPDADKPVGDSAQHSIGGAAFVHALRGITRFRLGDNAGAEADFNIAISGSAHTHVGAFVDTVQRSNLPMLTRVKDELNIAAPLAGAGAFFQLRGAARLNLNKRAEAEADFDEALAQGYSEGEVYFGRGSARLGLGNLAGAEQDATLAIERGKQDAATFALRGAARLALQSFVPAEADLSKAIDLDGDNAQTFVWRGAARIQLRQLADAEADFTAALSRAPDARTLYSRGCLRYDSQRYLEAEQDFTAALELRFEPPELFTFRGLARLSLERLPEAEADAAEAFARGAADIPSHSLRAAVRLVQERYGEAEADLSAAIELQRDDAWVRFHRGRAYQKLERFDEAEQDYLAALKFGSEALRAAATDLTELQVNLGRIRLAQHKLPQAIDDFTAAIAAGRDDAYVRYCLGITHQELKDYAAAEREYDLAIAHSRQAMALTSRGQLRLVRGNFAGAESDLSEALAANPNDAESLHARVLSRYGQKTYAAAIADCDAALAIAPEQSRTLGARVLIELRQRNLTGAAEDCDRLHRLAPDDAETHGCYGVLSLARGDFAGAGQHLRKAVESDSSWDYWRGLVALLEGQLDEARQAYLRAANACTPADNLLALDELEFYLSEQPKKITSAMAQSALAEIRTQLGAAK